MSRVEEQQSMKYEEDEQPKQEQKKRVRTREHAMPPFIGPFVFYATRTSKSRELTRTYEISHFNYFSSVYYRTVKLSPKKVSIIVEHLN